MLVCFIMTNQSLTSTMIKDDQSTVPTSCRMVYFFLMIQRPAVVLSEITKLWLFFLFKPSFVDEHHLRSMAFSRIPGWLRYASPLEYRQQRIPQLNVVQVQLVRLFREDELCFYFLGIYHAIALLENNLTSGVYIYT